jgi:2-oxo-4-hydroxy-4-carboxy--5-ureidoimidazoline (OHCU) decarboxylase
MLDHETRDEVRELAVAYRERFGFPLIVSARDVGDRYERVTAIGWGRMANAAAVERAAALLEVAKIANYRFDDLVADANPIASARVARYEEADR